MHLEVFLSICGTGAYCFFLAIVRDIILHIGL
jgi:hypothetical protein